MHHGPVKYMKSLSHAVHDLSDNTALFSKPWIRDIIILFLRYFHIYISFSHMFKSRYLTVSKSGDARSLWDMLLSAWLWWIEIAGEHICLGWSCCSWYVFDIGQKRYFAINWDTSGDPRTSVQTAHQSPTLVCLFWMKELIHCYCCGVVVL